MERLQVGIRLLEKWYKVEVIGCWTGFGGCAIWPLRMVLCLKIGALL